MSPKNWIISIAALAIAVILLANIGFTDEEKPKAESSLNWVRYDEGLKAAAEENKLILIDFYTNWCGWCKKMDRDTFSDDTVARYLNDKFVMVKVNAESSDKVSTAEGKLSEKSLSKSFGVRGYPTYWFLNSSGEKLNTISGYAPPERFMTVLKYFGENIYQTKTWQEYLEGLQAN